MTVATQPTRQEPNSYLDRPRSSSLADVVEIILDKGLVLDAYVRVSLVGIELVTIDARIVIASVDTYLKFAEATNRLDLYQHGGKDLPEVVGDSQEEGAKGKTSGAVEGIKKAVKGSSDDDQSDGGKEDDDDAEPAKKTASSRSSSGRKSSSGHRR